VLSPLPCMKSLDRAVRQEWIRDCVEQIVAEARRARSHRGHVRRPANHRRAGAEPHPQKRTPAPFFHAVSAEARHQMRVAYASFVDFYRSAAENLKLGLEAAFPVGCFPPAPPFVTPRAHNALG